MDVTTLKHASRVLPTGGKILVLNTGATITPEAEAMLQALHSRSIGGIDSHLQVLAEKGPEKFMSTYYVGYGHKSIGDCGTATVFIENVSMLVAKAIQDWPLYSGQESSTRYIDYTHQKFIDPVASGDSNQVLEAWRRFYLRGVEEMTQALTLRHPMDPGEKEGVYQKAIKARAFDVMRGFLPAGATTNLAWHSNLRQLADKINLLRHHPLMEVRDVAHSIEESLLEAYPSSFSNTRYEKTEDFHNSAIDAYTYFTRPPEEAPDFEVSYDTVDREELANYKDLLAARPPKTELPKFLADLGTIQFRFLLDFGSFRDLQRHRSVQQRMPLVTRAHGFNNWYLDEMTPSLKQEAENLLDQQSKIIEELGGSPEIEQYYIPMGYQLPNQVTGSLPALVYIAELRGTRFVHPTLRKRAKQIAEALTERFGEHGLVLHMDTDADRFDAARGKHDIVRKD